MKSAIYRARSGEYLRNPFGSEIETKYPEVFRVVDECVKPLEKYIGKQFQKDEISFLAMYFASMIEKQKMEQTKEQKVPVMLVGAMGRGTMKLLKQRWNTLMIFLKLWKYDLLMKIPRSAIKTFV